MSSSAMSISDSESLTQNDLHQDRRAVQIVQKPYFGNTVHSNLFAHCV